MALSNYNLPSKLCLSGDLPSNWKRFKQELEIYLIAAGLDGEKDCRKVAILLNVIGEDGLQIYNNFDLKKEEDKELGFKEILQLFENYCEPKQNVLFSRFLFYTRNQQEGESFDVFYKDVKKLSQNCKFVDSDDAIRDRVILGTTDKLEQEKLLCLGDIELDQAVKRLRLSEISKSQTKQVQGVSNPQINMSIIDSYKRFMERNSDPRTEEWILMSGPGPLLTILASYLYFCTSVGPRYMRDRKPYDLKHTILVYNVSQVLFSVFLVYEGLVSGWWNDYNFSCQPVDYSNSPKANRMAAAVWWYLMAKVVELLDTIFFVLRKKNRQISFLHLYHHFMMPICAWIGVKFLPGGHGTLLGVINSFIHVIMYTYYLISGLGPQYQKYLWWKKHVTTLQLIQFCIIFYHNFSVMFCDCNYPKFINFLLSLNAGLFLYMFGNFYYHNYVKIHIKRIENGKVKEENGHVKKETSSNGVQTENHREAEIGKLKEH